MSKTFSDCCLSHQRFVAFIAGEPPPLERPVDHHPDRQRGGMFCAGGAPIAQRQVIFL
jgi:hypothetical protein